MMFTIRNMCRIVSMNPTFDALRADLVAQILNTTFEVYK